jgi:hypothetical protein
MIRRIKFTFLLPLLLTSYAFAGNSQTDSIDGLVSRLRSQAADEERYIYQGNIQIVVKKDRKTKQPVVVTMTPRLAYEPPYRTTHYYLNEGKVFLVRQEHVLSWKKEEHELFYFKEGSPYHYRKLAKTKKEKEISSKAISQIPPDVAVKRLFDLGAIKQLLNKSVSEKDQVQSHYFEMNDIKLIHGSIIPMDVKMGKDTIRYDYDKGDWIYAEYTQRLTMLLWGTHGPKKSWRLPPVKNAYFAGKIPGYVLIDRGVGPDLREILVYPDAGTEAIFVEKVKGTFIQDGMIYILKPMPTADCKKRYGVFKVDLSLGSREKIQAGMRFTNQVFCL